MLTATPIATSSQAGDGIICLNDQGQKFWAKVQLIVRYLPHQIGYSNFNKTADNSKIIFLSGRKSRRMSPSMKGFEVLPMVGAGIIRKNYKAFIMVVIRLARGGAKTSILSNRCD